jgi:hypothetical protein
VLHVFGLIEWFGWSSRLVEARDGPGSSHHINLGHMIGAGRYHLPIASHNSVLNCATFIGVDRPTDRAGVGTCPFLEIGLVDVCACFAR